MSLASTSTQKQEIHWFTQDRISQLEPVACGTEGKIYKVFQPGNYGYVTKTVKVFHISDEERKEEIETLIHFTANGFHKNIVRIIGPLMLDDPVLATRRYGYIMESIDGGSLKSVIESERSYSPCSVYTWMTMAAEGLQFLCDEGILYRNIRPSNMLLTVDRKTLKLSDYGIRRRYNGKLKILNDNFYCYIAPEVLSGEGNVNNPAADVYSMGIVLWELLHRRRPYAEPMTIPMCEKIMDGERPLIDSTVSDKTKELLQECWSKDIQQRPTIEKLIEFFKYGHNDESVPDKKRERLSSADSAVEGEDQSQPDTDEDTWKLEVPLAFYQNPPRTRVSSFGNRPHFMPPFEISQPVQVGGGFTSTIKIFGRPREIDRHRGINTIKKRQKYDQMKRMDEELEAGRVTQQETLKLLQNMAIQQKQTTEAIQNLQNTVDDMASRMNRMHSLEYDMASKMMGDFKPFPKKFEK